MPDEQQAPTEGQPTEKVETSQEVKTETQVPNKFEGKSTEDVIKAYEELSKKIGEQGEKLGRTNKEKEELAKQIDNWNKLGKVIEEDPELYKAIEQKVKGKSSEEPTVQMPNPTDITVGNNIVRDFEGRYAISKLDPEKAKVLREKIGAELAEIYDPEGKKDRSNILNIVPINKLEGALEKAYRYATLDDKEEQARLRGMAEARQNQDGEFGSISFSGANSEVQLTPAEREAARKLGVSEQDYLKAKVKN